MRKIVHIHLIAIECRQVGGALLQRAREEEVAHHLSEGRAKNLCTSGDFE
jgi:hypothetical protein